MLSVHNRGGLLTVYDSSEMKVDFGQYPLQLPLPFTLREIGHVIVVGCYLEEPVKIIKIIKPGHFSFLYDIELETWQFLKHDQTCDNNQHHLPVSLDVTACSDVVLGGQYKFMI